MQRSMLVPVAAFLAATTLAFASPTTETTDADMRPVTISYHYPGQDANVYDMAYIEEHDVVWKYIEEKFNVKLEFPSTPGNFETVLTGMASGDIGDIVMNWVGVRMPAPTWRDWINDGLVIDLKEMVDAEPERYPILDEIFDDPIFRLYNEKQNGDLDSYYMVHQGFAFRDPQNSILFNGYMLEELGLAVPQTYDELIAAMRAAKRELGAGGFGWPTYGGTNFFGLEDQFFRPNCLEIAGMWQRPDGTWYDAAIDPSNKAMWEEIQGYAEEGLFYPNLITKEWMENLNLLFANKLLASAPKAPNPGSYTSIWQRFQEVYPDAVRAQHFPALSRPLTGPTGCVSQERAVPFQVRMGAFIPVHSDNPDRALDVLHYTLTDEFQNMRWFGIQGVHYTRDDMSDFDMAAFFADVKGIERSGRTFESMDPRDILWENFKNTTSYRSGIVPYEAYGNFYEAHQNWRNVMYERLVPHVQANCDQECLDVYYNWQEEGWKALPQWMDFIALSDEEVQIQKALQDVSTKWFVQFLLGNEDVQTEWDNYVAEYEAAGAGQFLAAWSSKAQAAQGNWERVVGK